MMKYLKYVLKLTVKQEVKPGINIHANGKASIEYDSRTGLPHPQSRLLYWGFIGAGAEDYHVGVGVQQRRWNWLIQPANGHRDLRDEPKPSGWNHMQEFSTTIC
jgi:hypothetical protein